MLEERGLIEPGTRINILSLREQLEKSDFLESLEQVSAEINARAGKLVVEVQSYMPPEPLVRSFTFKKGDADYVMQVELWEAYPTLVFLTRQWRGILPFRYFGWLLRLFGSDGLVVHVNLRATFPPQDVTREDIEKWLMYLLSGFDRSLLPPVPALPDESVCMPAVEEPG